MTYLWHNLNKRYEAVLYATKGVDCVSFFDDLEEACQWVLRQYAGFYQPGDAAAAVYDLQENRKRVFATDDPHGLLAHEPRN